jgi:hypothetical protein
MCQENSLRLSINNEFSNQLEALERTLTFPHDYGNQRIRFPRTHYTSLPELSSVGTRSRKPVGCRSSTSSFVFYHVSNKLHSTQLTRYIAFAYHNYFNHASTPYCDDTNQCDVGHSRSSIHYVYIKDTLRTLISHAKQVVGNILLYPVSTVLHSFDHPSYPNGNRGSIYSWCRSSYCNENLRLSLRRDSS